jgi:threonyl-tRNA synthetase
MNLRSYRDLPLRFAEFGRLHRNEVSGALGGMFRVRQITMDDAHIFCRRDQMLDEINGALDLINSFYRIFNFKMEYSLATRPKDAMGDPVLWEEAEKALKEALEKNKFSYNLKSGDGAFYGPKIDIQIKDALGRMWQLATVQLDFVMLPERFDLEYIAEDGSRQRPVAIHRAITGSFERFVGILTEHFAGAFPLWLSPVQVMIIPITERQHAFAHQLKKRMQSRKIRVQVDERNEKMNYKIREAENKKVPYMAVVGDKEVQGESVSVRQHKKGDLGSLPVEEFIETIVNKIKNKEIE